MEEGEKVIVGINKYRMDEHEPIPVLRIDPEVERRQTERLRDVRATRDSGRWRTSLDALRSAAKAATTSKQAELMPAFLECARAYASIGEQVEVLKDVFGEYHDPGYF